MIQFFFFTIAIAIFVNDPVLKEELSQKTFKIDFCLQEMDLTDMITKRYHLNKNGIIIYISSLIKMFVW